MHLKRRITFHAEGVVLLLLQAGPWINGDDKDGVDESSDVLDAEVHPRVDDPEDRGHKHAFAQLHGRQLAHADAELLEPQVLVKNEMVREGGDELFPREADRGIPVDRATLGNEQVSKTNLNSSSDYQGRI